MNAATHFAFSDESNWNTGRFRSIGLVTGKKEVFQVVEEKINRVLSESNVKELKWKKIDSAKYRFAAEKVLDVIFSHVLEKTVRIDVLIWDIDDTRHTVKNRCDIQNLERLYFRLLYDVLKKRWPDDAVWEVHPDEFNAIQWDSLADILSFKSIESEIGNLFLQNEDSSYRLFFKRIFKIDHLSEVKSHENVFSQIADIFAGMGWYSKHEFTAYKYWYSTISPQLSLFEDSQKLTLTNTQKERFPIIKKVRDFSHTHSLGVGLETLGALNNKNPDYPINFWWYVPQGDYDKAPIKKTKGFG